MIRRLLRWFEQRDLFYQRHFKDEDGNHRGSWRFGKLGLRYEVSAFPSTSCGLSVCLDDEELQTHVALPPLSVFVSVEHPLQRAAFYKVTSKAERYAGGMTTGIRVFEWALWWDVWHTRHEWKSTTPRWRHGSFHPLDAWFGRLSINTVERSTHDVLIPLAEKNYLAHVKLTDDTWTRARWPRWPFTKQRFRCNVDIPGGIPVPGKGENSYDCGDDATFGLSADARTPEEAVAQVVQSVMNTRRRRGGGTGTEPWKSDEAWQQGQGAPQ